MDTVFLKYPVGKYKSDKSPSQEKLSGWIGEIEEFPRKLGKLVANIGEEQLGWKYRSDGWTVRQVVHHCANSHANSFFRFKLALTEDQRTIKPYFEDKWALL